MRPGLHISYTVSEFNNVATASPVDVTSSGYLTGPNVVTGSMTTTQAGDLIYNFVSSSGDASQGEKVSLWTAGSGFALLDANNARGWCLTCTPNGQLGQQHASQWQIQGSAAPITSGITAAQPANNEAFLTLAVALKTATAGSPAPTSGIYVKRIHHWTDDVVPTGSVYKLQFPSEGNLLVLTFQEGFPVTAINDNKANTWTRATGAPASGIPQIWRTTTAGGAITGSDLQLTFTLSAQSGVVTFLAYDVLRADVSVGGDALDGSVEDPGANTGGAATATCPGFNGLHKLTPASTNGLVIVIVGFGLGPAGSFAAGTPTGAVFDVVISTGQTDGSNMDNSDGRGHYYNLSDLSAESYTWNIYNAGPYPTNGGIDAGFFGAAAHFKGAAVGGVAHLTQESIILVLPTLPPAGLTLGTVGLGTAFAPVSFPSEANATSIDISANWIAPQSVLVCQAVSSTPFDVTIQDIRDQAATLRVSRPTHSNDASTVQCIGGNPQ
jgi:hypothetical protein